VLVVTQPWSGPVHWVVFSIGAALCGAFYWILTRRLAGRDTTQQFYAALIATLGTAPLALPVWIWPKGAAG
jgi:drug/metabolite transporter (DMT)-like permease